MRAFALLVLLVGCSSFDQPPPPYAVYYCAGTPPEDVALWQGAFDEWETQVARGELFIEHAGERPEGACGLLLCAGQTDRESQRARYDPSECTPQIVYQPDYLFQTRQHELGHALGLGHASSGPMNDGDPFDNHVRPEDGARVRALWGW